MRTPPSFESPSSFEDLDSVSHESGAGTDAASRDDDIAGWGVVSTTGSEAGGSGRESAGMVNGEYIGEGILIMDGMDSTVSRDGLTSDLSIPGSASFPSDIGSLTAEQSGETNVFDLRSTLQVNKRVIFFVGCFVFFAFSAVGGLFVRQHYRYQSTVQQLGEKIQQLEKEKEELALPPWIEEDDVETESSLFTLLDNCWVKAKMNIKFGECSQNSYGLCGAFFHNATRTIGQWFDETFSTPDNDDESSISGGKEDDSSEHDIFIALAKYPEAMAGAIVSAREALSERLSSLNLGSPDDTDDLTRASEAIAEAFQSAGGFAMSELEAIGKNPVKYLQDVVDGASHPERKSKFSADGIQEFADSISKTTISWAESFSTMVTGAFAHSAESDAHTESKDEL